MSHQASGLPPEGSPRNVRKLGPILKSSVHRLLRRLVSCVFTPKPVFQRLHAAPGGAVLTLPAVAPSALPPATACSQCHPQAGTPEACVALQKPN